MGIHFCRLALLFISFMFSGKWSYFLCVLNSSDPLNDSNRLCRVYRFCRLYRFYLGFLKFSVLFQAALLFDAYIQIVHINHTNLCKKIPLESHNIYLICNFRGIIFSYTIFILLPLNLNLHQKFSCNNYISAFLVLIFTGGQQQQFVSKLQTYICFIISKSLHFCDIIIKLLFCSKINSIGIIEIDICQINSCADCHFISTITVQSIKANVRMFSQKDFFEYFSTTLNIVPSNIL